MIILLNILVGIMILIGFVLYVTFTIMGEDNTKTNILSYVAVAIFFIGIFMIVYLNELGG